MASLNLVLSSSLCFSFPGFRIVVLFFGILFFGTFRSGWNFVSCTVFFLHRRSVCTGFSLMLLLIRSFDVVILLK